MEDFPVLQAGELCRDERTGLKPRDRRRADPQASVHNPVLGTAFEEPVRMNLHGLCLLLVAVHTLA